MEKIEIIAKEIYGPGQVVLEPASRKKLDKFTELGYGHWPVRTAKTQASLTDDPEKLGAPRGRTLTVTDTSLSAGAGFVVAILGEMMRMPGLGKLPQVVKLDVNESGVIHGMI